MLSIGPHSHHSRVVVAPMAGVTDRPFRQLCYELGSHWMVSEMVTSDMRLWDTRKSRHRLAHANEPSVSWVQLAGADSQMMADAAVANVELGAQIIDINMGCPAKKVCKRAAGSALLRDEALVADILAAVVGSVSVPVTLKIRLGWSRDEMNAIAIGRIAQEAGISLLSVHGRTRACRFSGQVDYDAIGAVKAELDIPVLANGDIDSPQKAADVLARTGADGVMLGRAVQGRPWLPAQVDAYLATGTLRPSPAVAQVARILARHVMALHEHYGDYTGPRVARKHVGWALDAFPEMAGLKQQFNQLTRLEEQLALIEQLKSPLAA